MEALREFYALKLFRHGTHGDMREPYFLDHVRFRTTRNESQKIPKCARARSSSHREWAVTACSNDLVQPFINTSNHFSYNSVALHARIYARRRSPIVLWDKMKTVSAQFRCAPDTGMNARQQSKRGKLSALNKSYLDENIRDQ